MMPSIVIGAIRWEARIMDAEGRRSAALVHNPVRLEFQVGVKG